MRYEVKFIDDHELPVGHDWMLVQDGTSICLFMKASAVRPESLTEAWESYRKHTRPHVLAV